MATFNDLNNVSPWEAGSQPGFRVNVADDGRLSAVAVWHGGKQDFRAEADALTLTPLLAEVRRIMERPKERHDLETAKQQLGAAEADLALLQQRVAEAEAKSNDPVTWRQPNAGAALAQLETEATALRRQVGHQGKVVTGLRDAVRKAEAALRSGALAKVQGAASSLYPGLDAKRKELIKKLNDATRPLIGELAVVLHAMAAVAGTNLGPLLSRAEVELEKEMGAPAKASAATAV